MQVKKTHVLISTLLALPNAVQCLSCDNVVISNAHDADEIRQNCKIIETSLAFTANVTESINLDGVEEIRGDLVHYDANQWSETFPEPFSISMSTLERIEGNLVFRAFYGLQKLHLPKLTTVEGRVIFEYMEGLEYLDISKLQRLGAFELHARNLTTLKHEGLQSFTEMEQGNYVCLNNAQVESVDSFFKYPIEANAEDYYISEILIQSEYLPNVKKVNIGWSKVDKIEIMGSWDSEPALEVSFGSANATSVEVGELQLLRGQTNITRNSNLKVLSIESINIWSYTGEEADLTAVDKAANLSLAYNGNLEHVVLSSSAENWKDFKFTVDLCPDLNLSSEYRELENGERERIWYWPQGDIRLINLNSIDVSNEFFDSFLEYHNGSSEHAKVVEEFIVDSRFRDENGTGFNCTPFDDLYKAGALPGRYGCTGRRQASELEDLKDSALSYTPSLGLLLIVFVAAMSGTLL